jgi:hypothetical protein
MNLTTNDYVCCAKKSHLAVLVYTYKSTFHSGGGINEQSKCNKEIKVRMSYSILIDEITEGQNSALKILSKEY